MQDLKLVGVHDDGEHLVLATPDGQKYLLLVDDSLRAAVRLDRARLSQLQIESGNRLRPRDIQARIRAGQTAAEIAQTAGVPVELVRRFEGPVLAEREFVVRQAQAVRIRHAKGGSTTLGEIVNERLATRSVEEHDQTWDAWRGDDGVWMVSLTFEAGSRSRQARWSYDAQLRHVTPRDDEARWLTEDDVEEPGTRHPRLTTVGGTGRRDSVGDVLSRDRVYDIEADGGVRPTGDARPAAVANATVDLLDSLRERRGRRGRITDPEFAGGPMGADPPHSGPPRPPGRGDPPEPPPPTMPPPPAPAPTRSAPTASHRADSHRAGSPGSDTDDVVREVDVTAPMPPVEAEPSPPTEEDPASTTEDTPPVTERTQPRRARRASVPKWDDIVFGSRRE
ncbi:MAG: hypothetical protein QG622_885 [Actinomycetota bacterium]|nr:hypothetical protein [Actinomycetota bacterium]